jgi:hypothetical protein
MVLTYIWNLLEKLSNCAAIQELPAFYGTHRFITMFTGALHGTITQIASVKKKNEKQTFSKNNMTF